MTTSGRVAVYLEVGTRRTFAGALDWPGWSRSARTEEGALAELVAYAGRYAAVCAQAGAFGGPRDASARQVVERLKGSATTDFGAPDAVPAADRQPLDEAELERQVGLLRAAWRAFDSAMKATASVELRKGPRGGGRDRDQVVAHVVSAEASYARKIGVKHPEPLAADGAAVRALREDILAVLRKPWSGEELTRKGWPPRYAARRIAWHVLDHAWEIEDKSA